MNTSDALILHQFDSFWGLPNASPFCMKAEGYLRWRGIPYQVVVSSPRRSPSGQVPWVEHEGKVIADSQKIIAHFERGRADTLDAWMTARERGGAHMLRRLLEFDLFWQINYSRWVDPAGWARFAPDIKRRLPLPMRLFGLPLVRRRLLRTCRMLGLKPRDPQAAYDIGRRHIDAVADWLGEGAFMMGENISSVDFSALGVLGNIMRQPVPSPIREHANARENLVTWLDRMWDLTFRDWSPQAPR